MNKFTNQTKKLIFLVLVFVFWNNNWIISKARFQPNTLLWEVSLKSNPSKKAYLLGSIHIGIPELYPLHDDIMKCWDKSDVLAVELNILDMDLSTLLSDTNLLLKLISFTDFLSDKLPNNIYEKIKKQLTEMELAPEIVDRLTPLGAALMLEFGNLAKAFVDTNYRYQITDGIDLFFLKLAKQNDKKIVELESIEKQISVFEALNENIVSYLETILNKIDSDNGMDIYILFDAWKRGNINFFEKINTDDFLENSESNNKLRNIMLYNRNEEMASLIEKFIQSGTMHFVVIGTGHLVGNKSIIDILTKTKKYNIKRF